MKQQKENLTVMVSEYGPLAPVIRAGAAPTHHYYALTIIDEMLSSTFHQRVDPVGDPSDPKDGQRRQIWIPVVWLEYDNGAVKPLEVRGILKEDHGVTIFPLGVCAAGTGGIIGGDGLDVV